MKSKIKFIDPQAAWYLFLDFSEYQDSFEELTVNNDKKLQKLLIEKIGFVCIPGSAFGVESKDYCMRYSFVDIDKDMSYPNIIEGITKLCDFLETIYSN